MDENLDEGEKKVEDQTSIILTHKVFDKLYDMLINNVVSTSIAVRFTVITAPKKNSLKKLVARPIALRRTVD